MQTNDLLTINSLTKSFQQQPLFQDLNLSVKAQQTVCLLGKSGIGKTVLFDIVAGLLPPDSGTIYLKDQDITNKAGYMGYMQQKDLLLPFKTILDNICLPLLIKKVAKKQARDMVKPYLTTFGLAHCQDKYPHQISGGMRQRVALLRTYLYSAELILLDEPFSALDTFTKYKMYQWYQQMVNLYKFSTFFITHDINEAILLADKIYILAKEQGILHEIPIVLDKANLTLLETDPKFIQYKTMINRIFIQSNEFIHERNNNV